MIDFVGKRYFYFLLSAMFILPGFVSLLVPPGLRLGVDFTGGTMWRLRLEQPASAADVQAVFQQFGHTDAQVQTLEGNRIQIRTKAVDAATDEKERLATALRERVAPFEEESFESVGPAISAEIGQRAMLAVAMASGGILLYLAWAFRRMPGPFRWGACAIVALLHDALVLLGSFSIIGKLFGFEVNAMFVTAVLTVLGFSVHDTIVVFDRIRENMLRHGPESFEEVVNHSIAQTLVRSINTSLTVVLTVMALLLFGGVTTRDFALALLIGIVSGTYSSIFNAAQLLVVWENGELGRLFRLPGRAPRAA
ncbi:MAG: protein translocase subunit SecF [Chloroflexi bacterium]|nr:protein translocase subunit SecF [Chloroflexota bacterium]